MLPLAKEVQLDKFGGYVLSYNGAKIIDCRTNEVIYQKTLPGEVIPELYNAAVESNVGIISYDNDCVVVGRELDKYIELEARINHIPLKKLTISQNILIIRLINVL